MNKNFFLAALAVAALHISPLKSETLVSVKDANKAVLKLNAYAADGKLLRQSTAVFVSEKGELVAPYSALLNAHHAAVVDSKGKQYNLYRILGANSTTDLVKFSVTGVTKNDYFQIASAPSVVGSQLQILHYSTEKKNAPVSVSVESQEPYNDYAYYQISAKNDSVNFSCPLIDAEGNLVAFVQQNVGKNATSACAIDARFVSQLSIGNSLSALSSDLNALSLPKALPADKSEALNSLFLLPQADSIRCLTAYSDFVEAYPELPDGYVYRAKYWAAHKQFGKSTSEFLTALEKAKGCTDSIAQKEDAIHYAWSSLIYRNVVEEGRDSTLSNNWNLAKAIDEADQAYAAQPSSLYKVQKGNCYYVMRHYKEAFDNFKLACDDKQFASSETFFSAAKSLEMAQGANDEVLALLDSCIAHVPERAGAQYAQYYLERSQRLLMAEKYREAVLDYNQYEQLIGPRNLDERFYDLRSQAEEKAHMYQQAVDDLNTAINISKQPVVYQIDKAALLLNIGEFAQAIETAQSVLKTLPNNTDCYKIMGIAHGELKHKALAIDCLQKAVQLGDESANRYLEKYK